MNKVTGARLRLFREKYIKATQAGMSEEFRSNQSNYARIERGELNINDERLLILHEKFNLDINWLLTGEGTPLYIKPNFSENVVAESETAYGDTKKMKEEITALKHERNMYKKLYEQADELLKVYREK